MQIILKGQFDKVLVDGNKLPNWDYNSEDIVKGDSKVIKISVASILAKLHRDRICLEHDRLYLEYGFAKHKGYSNKRVFRKYRKI